MKIILAPNPYRDKQFQTALQAKKILEECGCVTRMCLPFDVDRDFELPRTIRFTDIRAEIRDADMLICFGGDGTILHTSKIATQHNLPVLGVNIGTMGFIAELESGELELLRKQRIHSIKGLTEAFKPLKWQTCNQIKMLMYIMPPADMPDDR